MKGVYVIHDQETGKPCAQPQQPDVAKSQVFIEPHGGQLVDRGLGFAHIVAVAACQ
jgi:hypothetical protein